MEPSCGSPFQVGPRGHKGQEECMDLLSRETVNFLPAASPRPGPNSLLTMTPESFTFLALQRTNML